MNNRSLIFAALVGGAVSGTVASVGLSAWRGGETVEPATSAPPEPPRATDHRAPPAGPVLAGAVRAVENRWAGLDQRLSALEERSSAEESDSEAEAFAEDGPDAEPTRDWFARRLKEHDAEPPDPEWAKSTGVELESDLARVRELGDLAVSRVSCRNTTCTAQVEWPDRATALREYSLLVHVPFRVNCERSIILPDAEPGATKVTASLLLDCESWRADGSPLPDPELFANLSLPSRRDQRDEAGIR